MNPIGEKYLRQSALPFLWCSGCGNGTVLNAAIRAIDELGIIKDVALVGGIGCSGWIPVYVKADVMHTLHGRPLAFATGLKMSNPQRKVIVFSGDGDCLGIGGNHFIHTARRNLDVTLILVNNQIYGMTGGQVSPCTPQETKSKTSVYGNPETPFDAVELARAAGASYISRWTTAHPIQLHKAIAGAIEHEGFALVEALSQCPTQAGRLSHGISEPVQLLDMIKSHTISIKKAQKAGPEDMQGKYVIGNLLKNREALEFACSYSQITAKAAC
ncbi:MAG: thiamine pyrophosphate-dependent enzyme [Desulfobacterales bacterium]|jgi:2-oxoglutarate ferredoxin oxidoreductase subunit beta